MQPALGQVRLYLFEQGFLGPRTHDPRALLALAEQDERRDLLEDRGDGPARRAPLGPEVDEYGSVTGDGRLEAFGGQLREVGHVVSFRGFASGPSDSRTGCRHDRNTWGPARIPILRPWAFLPVGP